MGYGTMGLSIFYGPPKPDEERLAILDEAHKTGNIFWDTADIYADSELLLAKWFKKTGKRSDIFLATKFANYMQDGKMLSRSDPAYVKECCAKSLERLGVEQIDLYYCHRVDKVTPIEDTVRAMKQLKADGKVKYLGLSEVSSATLRRACAVEHIDALQIEYSPFTMDIENPAINLLSTCRELGVAIIAYSPLSRGFLTGQYKSHTDFPKGDIRSLMPRYSEENFPKNLKLVEQSKALAGKKGVTVGQLVLAWLMAQGEDVFPIPGTTNIGRLNENWGAMGVVISEEENAEVRRMVEAAEVHGERYPPGLGGNLFADTPPLKA